MTVTTQATENDMTCLHRVEIKANGIIIWEIASESGHTYHVTMVSGHVSSCERTDGEPCKGWKYRHSCHHATLAQARELAFQDSKASEEKRLMNEFAAEIVADALAAPVAAPTTSERMQRSSLNGNREFRLMR